MPIVADLRQDELPMKWELLLSILIIVFLLGCGQQPANTESTQDSPLTQSSRGPTAAGQAFVREILDSLEEDRELPPSGGEQPRILTEAEKDRIMEIASSAPQVMEVMRNPGVGKVDTCYLWMYRSNGAGYLMHKPIEDGIVDVSDKPNNCYPAVSFKFTSKFDEKSRCGITVAVDLETGKVVFVGGSNATEMPRKKLPP